MNYDQRLSHNKIKKLYKDIASKKSDIPCSRKLLPYINKILGKMKAAIPYITRNYITHKIFYEIATLIEYAAKNTNMHCELNDDQLGYMQGILNVIHSIFKDFVYEDSKKEFTDSTIMKIESIGLVLSRNTTHISGKNLDNSLWKNRMIFKNYDHLFKIVDMIDKEAESMIKRGLTKDNFNSFMEYLEYTNVLDYQGLEKITEEDKFNNILMFLNGKKKLVPHYLPKLSHYSLEELSFKKDYVLEENEFFGSIYSPPIYLEEKKENESS